MTNTNTAPIVPIIEEPKKDQILSNKEGADLKALEAPKDDPEGHNEAVEKTTKETSEKVHEVTEKKTDEAPKQEEKHEEEHPKEEPPHAVPAAPKKEGFFKNLWGKAKEGFRSFWGKVKNVFKTGTTGGGAAAEDPHPPAH